MPCCSHPCTRQALDHCTGRTTLSLPNSWSPALTVTESPWRPSFRSDGDGRREQEFTTIRVAVGSTLFSTFRGLDFGVEYNLAPGVGYLYTGMNSTQAPRLGVRRGIALVPKATRLRVVAPPTIFISPLEIGFLGFPP